MWQDFVFTAGGLVFVLALLPSIIKKEPPALISCLITGGALSAFAVTYAAMTFWFSAATSLLTAGCWFVLALQRIRLDA